MDATSCQKNNSAFECEPCDYNTSKKSSFDKHLTTSKHLHRTQLTNLEQTSFQTNKFSCKKCNKIYKVRNSLWYHEQKCIAPPVNNEIINETNVVDLLINENKDFKSLILELMKNNTDLQTKMMDMCKNSNNTVNSHNKNSNNKTFNMQIFLNEHCKDAMNIKDFADSFQLQISDFEKVGHLGYVDGISDIIIKKLNELDVHKRPIHCSDTKRDIMYVHADNVWTKENSDHGHVR